MLLSRNNLKTKMIRKNKSGDKKLRPVGIGASRLTLDQLVMVQIHDPQLNARPVATSSCGGLSPFPAGGRRERPTISPPSLQGEAASTWRPTIFRALCLGPNAPRAPRGSSALPSSRPGAAVRYHVR